jgi:hypothetical protein
MESCRRASAIVARGPIRLLALFVLTAVIAGCSSSRQSANAPQSNSRTTVSRGANGADAAAAEASSSAAPVTADQPQGAIAAAAKSGKREVVDSGGPRVEPQRIKAAENSEVSTTMDSAGNFVETRWFKDHPQLDRVERTWQNDGRSTLRITLRDGRVVSAPGDSVKQMPVHPSNAFLELAGLKTAARGDAGATGARSR